MSVPVYELQHTLSLCLVSGGPSSVRIFTFANVWEEPFILCIRWHVCFLCSGETNILSPFHVLLPLMYIAWTCSARVILIVDRTFLLLNRLAFSNIWFCWRLVLLTYSATCKSSSDCWSFEVNVSYYELKHGFLWSAYYVRDTNCQQNHTIFQNSLNGMKDITWYY